MTREIKVEPSQDADLIGTLEKILKELKKMNLYLALMNDLTVDDENVEV